MSETTETDPWDLRLREATSALYPSHLRQPPTWIAFMREMDAEWQRYMKEVDTPERRRAEIAAGGWRMQAGREDEGGGRRAEG